MYFLGAELKNHNRFCTFSIFRFRPGGPKWRIWAKKWLFWTKMKIFIYFFIKAKFATYLNTNKGNKLPMEHIQLMHSYVWIKMCDFYRFCLVIFCKWPKIVLRGGQIQKIVNIEGFKYLQGVKNAYIHSTNGCTHETMDILSSYMHRPPI